MSHSLEPLAIDDNENPNLITTRLIRFSIYYLLLLVALSSTRYFVSSSTQYNDRHVDPQEIIL